MLWIRRVMSHTKYSLANLKQETKATCIIMLASTMYGLLGFSGIKLLHAHFSMTAMLFWRFCIAAIYMIIVSALRREKNATSSASIYVGLRAFIFGGIIYGISSLCYFIVSQHIGTGIAMVIFFSFPIYILIYEKYILNQQLNKITVISLLAIIMGLVLLSDTTKINLSISILLVAIFSALSYSIYILFSKSIGKQIGDVPLTMYVCAGSALVFLLMSIINHNFNFPTTVSNWGYLLILSLVCTALPMHFTLFGLRFLPASKVAILTALEPLTTLLIGVICLNERLSLFQTIGAAMVLLGVVYIQFIKSQTAHSHGLAGTASTV